MDSRATGSDMWGNKLLDPCAVPVPLPLNFLKNITSDFCNELEVGRGVHGVVYKGILRSGLIIAVKKLFGIHNHVMGDSGLFQKEVTFLMEIRHPNVVQLLGYCAESRWEATKLSDGNYVLAEIPASLLCFEYHCNEGLDKHISDESSGLEWNMRYDIIKGICSGLYFLHECNIVHLDLKPQNILMDATMKPKIADFGLSRLLGEQKSRTITVNRFGSFGYMPPEYINQGVISPKADIFSLGVIIVEIITGLRDYPQCIVTCFQHCSENNRPQSTETHFEHFTEKVLGSWRSRFERASKYTPMELYTQQVKQCIAIALKCVDPDSKKRPNALDIMETLNAADAAERTCCVQNVKASPVDHQEDVPLDMQLKDDLDFFLNASIKEDHAPVTARITEGAVKSAVAPPQLCLELGAGISNYQGARNAYDACKRPEDTRTQVSGKPESKILSVQPLELNLTNNTDERVSFSLLTKTSKAEHFIGPLSGVVPPRCTLAVTLQNHQKSPPNDEEIFTIGGSIADSSAGLRTCESACFNGCFSMQAEKNGSVAHQVGGWLPSKNHILMWASTLASCSGRNLPLLVVQQLPAVSLVSLCFSRVTLAALRQWWDCMARGLLAMSTFRAEAMLVILLWSFLVCTTSLACSLCALLTLGSADIAIPYMGYKPGLSL